MVWTAFIGFDKSPLVIMPQGEKTAADFVENVYEGILSGFYFMHDQPHELILMEDGVAIHQSKLLENWRQAHGMKKLIWPPNSPNLNSIQNLWNIIKNMLCHHNRPKNKQEMIQTI